MWTSTNIFSLFNFHWKTRNGTATLQTLPGFDLNAHSKIVYFLHNNVKTNTTSLCTTTSSNSIHKVNDKSLCFSYMNEQCPPIDCFLEYVLVHLKSESLSKLSDCYRFPDMVCLYADVYKPKRIAPLRLCPYINFLINNHCLLLSATSGLLVRCLWAQDPLFSHSAAHLQETQGLSHFFPDLP